MAHLTDRRPENIAGEFYVDSSCIDCDTCRWMAPTVFQQAGDMSAVYHQPTEPAEKLQALQALLSCPTASIGTRQPDPEIRAAQASLPLLIADNVYHCGYHSEKSYAAASYLILLPTGNVLVDSPRFTPPLVNRIEELGGVKYMYLTHRDDVADHQKFHDRFNCTRIMHQDDIGNDTKAIEEQLTSSDIIQWLPEMQIIPVPGHSKGHTVLLYRNQFLFSGDHLAYSDELQHLYAWPTACWYSWPTQLVSLQKLTQYQFSWVLPGHGRRFHAQPAEMQASLSKCLAWAKQQ
jgi:glyoxylase-like metal-dependent hydrolase (beta-lactamase superfamily II)/ferredoxin